MVKQLKKIHAGITGTFAAVGVAVAAMFGATPAQAGVYQCTAGYVCGWDGSGYAPDSAFFHKKSSGNLNSSRTNKTSSVSNRTGSVVFFYRGKNYSGGAGLRLGNGGTYVNLQGQVDSKGDWNDDIESVVVA